MDCYEEDLFAHTDRELIPMDWYNVLSNKGATDEAEQSDVDPGDSSPLGLRTTLTGCGFFVRQYRGKKSFTDELCSTAQP